MRHASWAAHEPSRCGPRASSRALACAALRFMHVRATTKYASSRTRLGVHAARSRVCAGAPQMGLIAIAMPNSLKRHTYKFIVYGMPYAMAHPRPFDMKHTHSHSHALAASAVRCVSHAFYTHYSTVTHLQHICRTRRATDTLTCSSVRQSTVDRSRYRPRISLHSCTVMSQTHATRISRLRDSSRPSIHPSRCRARQETVGY
jgi:hypothetical protein